MTTIQINTCVDVDLHTEAKRFNISWAEAIRLGIHQILKTEYNVDGELTKETAMSMCIKLRKCNVAMQEQINRICTQLNEQGIANKDIKTIK